LVISLILSAPLFTNDAIVLGILLCVLAVVFKTSESERPFFKKFYTYVPALLLCYFIPAFLNYPFGLISPKESNLYFIASRYLLPASLVLLTLSIDFKGIINLGPKALMMFFTGTFSVIIGGPIALLTVAAIAPEAFAADSMKEVWRGLATVAGSWIGGGANQTAMKEVFEVDDSVFSAMIIVDVFVANLWMAVLLYGAGVSDKIDKFFKADASAITELKENIINYQKSVMKIPTLTQLMVLMAVCFAVVGFSHLMGDTIAPWVEVNAPFLKKFSFASKFFWLIVFATSIGLILSFTKARKLEGYGASRVGSLFLYILVATIGMKMDINELKENWEVYRYFILIGLVWMLVHITILLTVAKLIRAPFFFTALGSQANIGGAASAPIVASAFHPSLAPVGVLLAVLGYALGTYGAWLCAQLMRIAS